MNKITYEEKLKIVKENQEGYGQVSMKDAKKKASEEYEAFNKTQKIESDFDKSIKKLIDKS